MSGPRSSCAILHVLRSCLAGDAKRMLMDYLDTLATAPALVTAPTLAPPKSVASAPSLLPEANHWPALSTGCGKSGMPPRSRAHLRALRAWLPGGLQIDNVDEQVRRAEAIKATDAEQANAMLLKLRSEIIVELTSTAGAAKADLWNAGIPVYSNDTDDGRICIGRWGPGAAAPQRAYVDVADAAAWFKIAIVTLAGSSYVCGGCPRHAGGRVTIEDPLPSCFGHSGRARHSGRFLRRRSAGRPSTEWSRLLRSFDRVPDALLVSQRGIQIGQGVPDWWLLR